MVKNSRLIRSMLIMRNGTCAKLPQISNRNLICRPRSLICLELIPLVGFLCTVKPYSVYALLILVPAEQRFIIHPCDPTVVICYLIWPCDITLLITHLISYSSSLSCHMVIKEYFMLGV